MNRQAVMQTILKGRCVIPGIAAGEVLRTTQAISFWGGVDPETGCICDPKHELYGRSVAGRVLVFPIGKGSSSAGLVLLELVRIGRAPAALINLRTEPILATGPIISRHFYKQDLPVMTLDEAAFERLETGQQVVVDATRGEVAVGEKNVGTGDGKRRGAWPID